MITKRREVGFWVFDIDCDVPACGNTKEFEDVDFHGTVAGAKAAGWKVKKTASGWDHICPGCTGGQ